MRAKDHAKVWSAARMGLMAMTEAAPTKEDKQLFFALSELAFNVSIAYGFVAKEQEEQDG